MFGHFFGGGMSHKNWVLMSEALLRVAELKKDDPDPDLSGRKLILSNAGKCPTKAGAFIRARENWRQSLSSETLTDYELPQMFWDHAFGRDIAGLHGIARKRQPDFDHWWDWPNSEFAIISHYIDDNFITVHEAQTAIGVEIHWPSLLANIRATSSQADKAQFNADSPPPANRGGRRPDYDWLQAFAYVVALAVRGKIDEDPTTTELANHFAEWGLDNYGREPSSSTRMKYASRIVAEIKQLQFREDG